MRRFFVLLLAVSLAASLVPGCGHQKSLPTSAAPQSLAQGRDAAPGALAGTGLTQFYSFAGNLSIGAFSEYMRIDPVNGQGAVSWSLGLDYASPRGFPTPLGLTFDLDGTLYTIVDWITGDRASSTSQLARVDRATGVLTYIGPDHSIHFSGPEIDDRGDLYATGFEKPDQFTGATVFVGDANLYRFDKRTGEATLVGPTGITVDAVMDLACDSQGRLWATTANQLFRIDKNTGAATQVAPITGVPQDHPPMEIMSIAFNDRDVLYGTAIIGFCTDYCGPAPVFRIDTATGAAAQIGHTGQPFNHGGDTAPNWVQVCHRAANGRYNRLLVSIESLPDHRAHGDVVPYVDIPGCDCPTTTAGSIYPD